MARKTLNSLNLLKIMNFTKIYRNSIILCKFQIFCKFMRNRKIPSPCPMGHRKPAQTIKNLRNYIGFGEANQLRDHQNQPGSSRIMISALWAALW
jgi:hypothetical protein